MMREIAGVAQGESAARRRWFHDEYFDLFVWQNGANEIESFQLCYGIDTSERALEWRRDGGFFHDGAKPGTPISGRMLDARQKARPESNAAAITSRFEFAARTLPEEILRVVTARIHEYMEESPTVPARRRRVRRAAWQQRSPEKQP